MNRSSLILRLLYVLSSALFPILVILPPGNLLTSLPMRMVVFLLFVLGGAWLMQRAWSSLRYPAALLLTGLVYGTVYKLASFIPDVSTYPFSLAWSEISRYYYASLFFARQLYGERLPLSVLHPTRYLMQSLPFLLPDSPLWLHRMWQVFLWVGSSALAAWLLHWRLRKIKSQESGIQDPLTGVALVLFAFLFFFQGPVYYHLLLMVILVLWGYDSQRPWKTLAVVLLASLWAGLSRINWLPVPGMLAAVIYLLEIPLTRLTGKSAFLLASLRYISLPALWVILGTGAGYVSQEAYKLFSGNPPEVFGSSFSSDLLWYRLLPNPTYPLGILPSAVLVSLPLLLLASLMLWHTWRDLHLLRLFGLAGILAVLFAGGVVVSVKIGGGSNLHNLDAYLVLLLLICAAVYLGALRFDHPQTANAQAQLPAWLEPLLLALTVAIPIGYALSIGSPQPQRDPAAADQALQAVAQAVEQSNQQGKEVLFISQRHLLTFGMLGDTTTPLVDDYELVFLMEMAMAGNRPYLDAFQAELKQQRYGLIVSGPLTTNLQGRLHSFGEENDAWVKEISTPILCYYEPVLKQKDPALMLLVPRASPCNP
jgi:hypothetical protein